MAERKLENGRDLLNACIDKMKEKQSAETGGNVALYPVLTIFLGEKCIAHAQDLKGVLDDNWNNARFLRFVGITGKEGAWEARSICCDEDQKECTGSPQEVVDQCIMEMLETEEKIFGLRNLIKMEFVLESSEENGVEMFDLHRKLNAGRGNVALKSLYLMLNENSRNIEASDTVLRHIRDEVEKDEKNEERVCIISDALSSNTHIPEKDIWKNYRLVADIILLNSNKNVADQKRNGMQGTIGAQKSIFGSGFSTASYALIQKPFRDIAVISLQSLLKEMLKQEEEIFSAELSNADILKRLHIDGLGQLDNEKQAYETEIRKKIPGKWQMAYLPFKDEKEMNRLLKDKNITERELDMATCGVWGQYKNQKIRQIVERYFNRSDKQESLKDKMYHTAESSFSYQEYLKMVKDLEKEEVLEAVKTPVKDSGSAGDRGIYGLHIMAENSAKAYYHQELKDMLAERMGELMDASLEFEEYYKAVGVDVKKESNIMGDIDPSVEQVYPGIVREYVLSRKRVGSPDAPESAFPEVFVPEFDKKRIIAAVWEVFQEMLEKQKEYSLDFEKELDMRLKNMNDEKTRKYIRDTIEKEINSSTRLGMMLYGKVNPTPIGQSYYLINRDAGYAEELRDKENYILFDNNRTDCIEELQIYSIPRDRLSMLQLIEKVDADE